MKQSMKTAFSFCFLLGVAATGYSQTAPQDTAKENAVPGLLLRREAALQKKVSFEAKRMPLPQLLAELQKQSSVTLQIEPGEAGPLLVTARFADMPLGEVMQALSRLYDREWRRLDNGTWQWPRASQATAVEVDLRRLGDMAPLENRLRLMRQAKMRSENNKPVDWFGVVLPATNIAALSAPQGVALTSLPDDVQLRIRRDREADAAFQLVGIYQRAALASLRESQWQVVQKKDAANASEWAAALMSPDGKILLSLPSPEAAKPPEKK